MQKNATRLSLNRTFTVDGDRAAARDAVLHHLLRTGLRLIGDEPGEITAAGGSQLVVRTFGVWFANPDAYPREVRIDFTPTAGGTLVDVGIEEALGFGYLDRWSRRRYLSAFQAWLDGLGSALGPQSVPH